ncbi:MAG: beta-N-acetylhexosaminidase [Candidatus Eremiobacteraeota bacterium]|nr:beta-N-acetylhexosaminidase [Candidatus Eremiobacteraeota bacterium]
MNDIRTLAAGAIAAGFDGYELTPEIVAAMDELQVGGWILFGHNVRTVEQARDLTDAIRARYPADAPPILAIDQEGGRVARLRVGVEEIPAMMAVAATDDEALARRAGEQMAFDLRRAGLNVDYAPVLDLALERMNTVIGSRSFGAGPHRASRFAGAFAAGLEAGGMVATFKHFPGHGSTAVDSHLELPTVDVDEATLRSRDLVPFATLLPKARALMTAHIVARAFDRVNSATVSHAILTGLLRTDIGFTGVCFTDCMEMHAIARTIGSAKGAVDALIAGADCVLISHSLSIVRDAIGRIERAVDDGSLALERLQEANARVTRLRRELAAPLPLDAPAPHAGIGREIGRAAVTLVRGDARADANADIVVSFEGATTEGVQGAHSRHAALEADGLEYLRAPLDPDETAAEGLFAALERSRKRPIVLMRRAHIYPGQARVVERIVETRPDALLISTREPFDVAEFPRARNVLCTYGDDRPSIEGLGDVLFHGLAPTGVLPLEIAAV